MAELTLEQLLTAMKRRQPLPPEIRQDIIEGASKVGSFLWEGSGPGIAMGMAKMRIEDPDLSLSDMFPAVVGAGVLRGGGKFRPRVVQGGFSNLDDAQKFALTAERQSVRKQTLSEIFEARKAKEAAITPEEKLLQRRVQRTEDLARRRSPEAKARRKLLQPGKLKRPTRRELSELPKEEQDRILKAFDEGRIEEVKIQGPVVRAGNETADEFAERAAKSIFTDDITKLGDRGLMKLARDGGLVPDDIKSLLPKDAPEVVFSNQILAELKRRKLKPPTE